MYLIIAMLVAVLSVFGLSLLGAILGRERVGLIAGISLPASIGYGLFLWLLYWLDAIGIYGPAPLAASIIIGATIASIILVTTEPRTVWLPSLVAGGYLIYILLFVLLAGQSDIFNASDKARLIGGVNTIFTLDKVMEPADTAHICLVSQDIAKVSVQNALSKFRVKGDAVPGSRYTIGTPTKQFVDGQLWWIFPLEFRGWLKWRQDRQVPGYLRVSAENPYQEAQPVQVDKTGREIHIQYLNSACFGHKAVRYLRGKRYLTKILKDWTFEVDDNWRPYYTASVVEREFGYVGYKTKGVVALDLQSGEPRFYDLDSLPTWIDRAVPLQILDYNVKKWGMYGRAGWWYTLWHNDKSQEPTPGWYMTYSQAGHTQWFSGMTSISEEDKALTGFVVLDARNGKATFFTASGVTEDIAFDTARSLWSNFKGYEPASELVPYNIYGRLTYVVPTTYEGQFRGVSLISLNNVAVKAMGSTIEQALSGYRAEILRANSSGLAPTGGDIRMVEIKGKISRIGIPLIVSQGQQQIFSFTLDLVPKVFQVVYAANPKALVMRVGDSVVVGYADTKEPVITVSTFDIPDLKLSDESPTQARYVTSQAQSKVEVDRITAEEKRVKLLQDERLQEVDPEKLEEFLRNQGTRK